MFKPGKNSDTILSAGGVFFFLLRGGGSCFIKKTCLNIIGNVLN